MNAELAMSLIELQADEISLDEYTIRRVDDDDFSLSTMVNGRPLSISVVSFLHGLEYIEKARDSGSKKHIIREHYTQEEEQGIQYVANPQSEFHEPRDA